MSRIGREAEERHVAVILGQIQKATTKYQLELDGYMGVRHGLTKACMAVVDTQMVKLRNTLPDELQLRISEAEKIAGDYMWLARARRGKIEKGGILSQMMNAREMLGLESVIKSDEWRFNILESSGATIDSAVFNRSVRQLFTTYSLYWSDSVATLLKAVGYERLANEMSRTFGILVGPVYKNFGIR